MRLVGLIYERKKKNDLILGLPQLRTTLTPPRRLALRSFFAISFQELHEAKNTARKAGEAMVPKKAIALVEARTRRRTGGGEE